MSCSGTPTVPLDGSAPTAPAARPRRPRPRLQPHRCVWGSTSQVSPWTCSPAQLQAQFSFLFNPQINMCSYIFNREAVFIRVGISVTSFSPLLRRHAAPTWNISRFMRKRPGQARETANTTPGRAAGPCARAPSSCRVPAPLLRGQARSLPSPPDPAAGPHAGKLPGVLEDLLPPSPAESQENGGQRLLQVTLSLTFQE